MATQDHSFVSTLDSLKVVLRGKVLLASFAVCALILELQTLVVLKFLQTNLTATDASIVIAGQGLAFFAAFLGIYLVTHEAHNCLHMYPEDEVSFLTLLRRRPGVFLLPPLAIAAAILLVLSAQSGLAMLMERYSLPAIAYPLVYIVQFVLSVVAILIAVYALVNAFLWYSHARNRKYGFRPMVRSFNSLLAGRTYKVVVYTAVWTAISVGLFLFVFFPLWKLSVARPLRTAKSTMAERFEVEVTGSNTVVDAVCDTLTGSSLTIMGTAKDLAARENQLSGSLTTARQAPKEGLLLLAAIVLTFGLPVALALAVLAAAGSASYKVITADRSASRTMTTRVGDSIVTSASAGVSGISGVTQVTAREWPAPEAEAPVRQPREDDTLIDHIATVPDDDDDPLRSALETDPMMLPLGGTGRSKREKLEKFVDFDYQAEPVPENQSFGDKGGKLPQGPRKFKDEPDRDKKFLREPRKQTLPEKGRKDDEDFNIFEDMPDK